MVSIFWQTTGESKCFLSGNAAEGGDSLVPSLHSVQLLRTETAEISSPAALPSMAKPLAAKPLFHQR
jgi:hypothetical protein